MVGVATGTGLYLDIQYYARNICLITLHFRCLPSILTCKRHTESSHDTLRYAQACAASRVSGAVPTIVKTPSTHQFAWMRPSPVRQHPMQRVAAAAAVVTRQRQQQLTALVVGAPTHDDLVDPLTGLQHPPQLDAGWVAAYRRLQLPRLPTALRVFAKTTSSVQCLVWCSAIF
jgi:hypothetical protein